MSFSSNGRSFFVGKYQRLAPPTKVLVTAGLVLLIWVVDLATGTEISFSIFYLLPVALISTTEGWRAAVFVSILCGVAWGLADTFGGTRYSHPLIPIWNSLVRVLIFLLVARLILNLRQTLKKAADAEDAARAATRMKTDFLTNMSHDIRTPLNALLGVSDLMAETPLNQIQRRYLEVFRAEGDHLRRLINDILDLSKIEAGKLSIETTSVHVGELARSILETFTPRAEQQGLQMRFNIESKADRCWKLDAHRLRRILANLLSNALKFTSNGSIEMDIRTASQPNSRVHLTFSVTDTGSGIPQALHSQVFKRFEQMSKSQEAQSGGSGLGLSITKALVERMNGTIGFESDPAKGSRFFFTLPTEVAEPADAASPGDVEAQALQLISASGKRILMVEDYRANQLVFAAYLNELDCQIEIAEDGRQGVSKFESELFDLVLMDIQMPVLDGWSATREIRAIERSLGRKPTSIIALTASALAEDRERCREAGCSDFLPKPVSKKEMLAVIGRFLGAAHPNHAATTKSGTRALDPEIAGLVPEFMAEAGRTMANIRLALSSENYDEVGRCGHQLSGSGTTFGFPEISRLGALLEAAACTADRHRVLSLADQLEGQLRLIIS